MRLGRSSGSKGLGDLQHPLATHLVQLAMQVAHQAGTLLEQESRPGSDITSSGLGPDRGGASVGVWELIGGSRRHLGLLTSF
jgi:hypothetical protein